MEPITASVITGLVCHKFIEKMADKVFDGSWDELKKLKERIAKQFQDNPKALASLSEATQAQNAIQGQEKLTKYLDLEMLEDPVFADEIQKLAQPIITLQAKNNTGVKVGSQTAGRDIHNIGTIEGTNIKLGGF